MASRKSPHLGYTVRGGGRVYVVIDGVDDQTDRLVAHARTEAGQSVPCRIAQTEAGEKSLVLPVLGVPMEASVRLVDDEGVTVGVAHKRIDPRGAHFASGLNARRDAALAARLRTCDEDALPGKPRVERVRALPLDDEAYPDVEGGAIHLWMLVSFEALDEDMPGEALVVNALGEDGNSIAIGEPVTLGRAVRPARHLPGASRLMEAVSLTIRRPRANTCVTMGFADMPSTSTFVCLEEHVMDAMVNGAYGLMTDPWGDPGYPEWFQATRASSLELEWQRENPDHFDNGPMFSVVVPLYKTPVEYLRDMAGSVLRQTYTRLELILVNATPEDAALAEAVSQLEHEDQRVHVIELDDNYGITRNTRAGVDMARGDFVCYLDHDDVVEPDILWRYAQAITDDPSCDMLYCDEDKLLDGRLVNPSLKPDWSPAFLETNNYLCHMLCVRRALLDAIRYPDERLDGAQDHDIALAVGECARSVCHVPRVLYHWRIHEGSTAGDDFVKPESLVAGRIALTNHLVRSGVVANVEDVPRMPHAYDIVSTPDSSVRVVILAVSHLDSRRRTPEDISEYLRANTEWPNIDVTPVFVGSDCDEGCDAMTTALRRALRQTRADYVAIVDADAQVNRKDWLQLMMPHVVRDNVGVVGAVSCYRDGRVRSCGYHTNHFGARRVLNRYVPTWVGPRNVLRLTHEVAAVSGTLVAGQTSTLLGLVMAHDTFVGTDWGVDLSLRARSEELDVVCVSAVRATEYMDEFELRMDGADGAYGVAAQAVRAEGGLLERFGELFGQDDPYYPRAATPDGGWRLDVKGAVER